MRNFIIFTFLCFPLGVFSQVNEDEIGAWYIYFFSGSSKQTAFGIQGDVQYRNWNQLGDLEQLLLRMGATYTIKKSKTKFTLGTANITSGVYGKSKDVTTETRFYQELLQPQKLMSHVFLTHRLRLEQRFVQQQNFRTRYRYTLFVNVPINKSAMQKDCFFVSAYNEIFMNGEREIGGGRTVNWFDRNRVYLAMGYHFRDNLKLQVGVMNQTSTISKYQLQYSLHHNF